MLVELGRRRARPDRLGEAGRGDQFRDHRACLGPEPLVVLGGQRDPLPLGLVQQEPHLDQLLDPRAELFVRRRRIGRLHFRRLAANEALEVGGRVVAAGEPRDPPFALPSGEVPSRPSRDLANDVGAAVGDGEVRGRRDRIEVRHLRLLNRLLRQELPELFLLLTQLRLPSLLESDHVEAER